MLQILHDVVFTFMNESPKLRRKYEVLVLVHPTDEWGAALFEHGSLQR